MGRCSADPKPKSPAQEIADGREMPTVPVLSPIGGYPTATTHLAGSLFALGQHRELLSKKRGCPNSSE